MARAIFPKLLGSPTKLDFILPEVCGSCGSQGAVALREFPLVLSRYGNRLVEDPGFVMDIPLCKRCELGKVSQPVTLSGANRSFIGRVTGIFLHCRNHEFAQAFKAANCDLIKSGKVRVIDGGAGV